MAKHIARRYLDFQSAKLALDAKHDPARKRFLKWKWIYEIDPDATLQHARDYLILKFSDGSSVEAEVEETRDPVEWSVRDMVEALPELAPIIDEAHKLAVDSIRALHKAEGGGPLR